MSIGVPALPSGATPGSSPTAGVTVLAVPALPSGAVPIATPVTTKVLVASKTTSNAAAYLQSIGQTAIFGTYNLSMAISAGAGMNYDTVGTISTEVSANLRQAVKMANGDVYFTNTGGTIQKIPNGSTTPSDFASPGGLPYYIAIDQNGDLVFTDFNEHRIKRCTVPGASVTTIAGSGVAGDTDANGTSAQFRNPLGLCVDSTGIIYVTEYAGHRVRKIATNGDVTTLAGSTTAVAGNVDATGTAARFDIPWGIDITDDNTILYVCDYTNVKVRKIVVATAVVTTHATLSYNPQGVGVDPNGNAYAAHTSHAIIKITSGGSASVFAGAEGVADTTDGTLANSRFYTPNGVTVAADGTIVIANLSNPRIRKITGPANKTWQWTWGNASSTAYTSYQASLDLTLTDTGNQKALAFRTPSSDPGGGVAGTYTDVITLALE